MLPIPTPGPACSSLLVTLAPLRVTCCVSPPADLVTEFVGGKRPTAALAPGDRHQGVKDGVRSLQLMAGWGPGLPCTLGL